MKTNKHHFFIAVLTFLFTLLIPFTALSFNSNADSLLSLLKNDKADTNKVKHLVDLAWDLSYHNTDTALVLANEALQLSGNIRKANPEGSQVWITTTKQVGHSYYEIASFNDDKGNYVEALQYYQKGLDIADILEKYIPKVSKNYILDRKSRNLGSIGLVYQNQGNFPKALEFYLTALKMAEEMGKADNTSKPAKNLAATWLGNIGNIYYLQMDYPKALEYYFKAYKKQEELGAKVQMATWLSNIGLAYADNKQPDKALEFYLKAKKLNEETGAQRSLASNYGNIASLYRTKKEYSISLDNYMQALDLHTKTRNKKGLANCTNNIGALYNEMYRSASPSEKKVIAAKAENYLLQSLAIADSIGYLIGVKEAAFNLSELATLNGKYLEALEYYKRSTYIKDTLYNADRKDEITRKALNYEFEKKEAETKTEQDKKDTLAAEDRKRQKLITYSIAIGLLLVAAIAIIILRSLRITRKQKSMIEQQKKTVEDQKELIEEKQKEIIDSITYAKRLQHAILPSPELIKLHLPESFIYYKPKDIVAGDFYWMEVIRYETGDMRYEKNKTENISDLKSQYSDLILIAAADSTGHGVPGAMVSIVCSNALNRAVKEFQLKEPGKILDKTRELVLETFEKSSADVKDGMDISLVSIDRSTNTIQWSGANNPLWYTSPSINSGEIIEIKADKQPIGKTDQPKPFTTHIVKLEKGDMIYLMTDGYPDQFGGPSGKKFKHKQLKDILFANSEKEAVYQEKILAREFDSWKGNLEQIDDVTLIGIRI